MPDHRLIDGVRRHRWLVGAASGLVDEGTQLGVEFAVLIGQLVDPPDLS